MKITAFNPLIVTRDPDSVIQLYESMGFKRIHTKEGISDEGITAVRMKSANGSFVDVATGGFPQDRTIIRMNVDDRNEAYKILMAHGFKRAGNFSETSETPSSKFDILVSPSGLVFNIIEHVEEKEKLKEENRKLKRIINALMFGYTTVCEVNFLTGDVEYFQFDDRVMSRLGLSGKNMSSDDVMISFFDHGIYDEDKEEIQSVFNQEYLLANLKEGSNITRLYRSDQKTYVEIKAVRTGQYSVLIGFTDKDKEIEEQNEHLYTDSLTRVKNRRFYDERLASEKSCAVAMSDIDHFKNFNDTYGHKCGDEVLKEVASVLRSNVRSADNAGAANAADTVVRYGGDEFLISFVQITHEELQERMETLRHEVEKIRLVGYPQLRLTMSFGVVYGDGQVNDMMKAADEVLYDAKEKRNTVIITPFA